MKIDFAYILLAATMALIALLVSQALWMSYASMQNRYEQDIIFSSCFNQSISSLIRKKMDNKNVVPVSIMPIDSSSLDNLIKRDNPKIVDAGDIKEDGNVAVMIENALIAMKIREKSLNLSELDTLLTTLLEEKGSVVTSHITLTETNENKIIDKAGQKYIKINSPLFVKSYSAQREIEIPDGSYLIRAEYRIKQPGYLKRLGVVTVVSFVASVIIISVLFYLLFMLKRRVTEIANMERSFHGAIHDLKSPLAFVFFQLSLLEEDETDMIKKSSLSLTADRVSFLTDKIMRLLKSAQNIDKIDESDKTDVSLYDVLEQIEGEMHTMFPKKKISFKNQADANFTIHVLPDLIEASIRIIIENAVKFSGEVPVVVISAIQDVDNIKISIADNGVGMSRRQMKNIFKPYFTTDTLKGNGIGLYYAQSIVKAHNGKISVKSGVGNGSEFIITLPNR